MRLPYGLNVGTVEVRTLNGLISRYERPVLERLATSLPSKIKPDHLTIAGVLGALFTSLCLVASHASTVFLWLALGGLLINWAGDSLDGTLARLRRIERPRYGFFVDHLSDVASQVLIVLGLGLSPYLRFDIICVGLIAYLIVTIYTLVKLHVLRSMQLTYFGIGPTEVRVLIGAGIFLAATTEPALLGTPLGTISMFDSAVLAVVVFAIGSAMIMFVRDAAHLTLIDPPRYATPVEVTMVQVPLPGEELHSIAAVSSVGSSLKTRKTF
jgi:archaetidylinositol phosphate synthase